MINFGVNYPHLNFSAVSPDEDAEKLNLDLYLVLGCNCGHADAELRPNWMGGGFSS